MKTAIALTLLVLVAACAPGMNDQLATPDAAGVVAGFWRGLWHGFIAPFTFLLSLFSDSINVYEVHNNGGWYNFGYLIGISAIFGGGTGGSCAARWRRR